MSVSLRQGAVLTWVLLALAWSGCPGWDCWTSTPQQMTQEDGGTLRCVCRGSCGCFDSDGGRCP